MEFTKEQLEKIEKLKAKKVVLNNEKQRSIITLGNPTVKLFELAVVDAITIIDLSKVSDWVNAQTGGGICLIDKENDLIVIGVDFEFIDHKAVLAHELGHLMNIYVLGDLTEKAADKAAKYIVGNSYDKALKKAFKYAYLLKARQQELSSFNRKLFKLAYWATVQYRLWNMKR